MNQHLTTTAAAGMLHVDPLTVCKWVDRGFLKAYRTAGGHRRILADDLLHYLVEHQMPVPPEFGENHLQGQKAKTELASINRELKRLRVQVAALEARRAKVIGDR